jgi:dipeptidyl aminopeptidase/acylaminoacyl peptidase
MPRLLPAALLLCAASLQARAETLRDFLSVAISPDGARVASIEGDAPAGGGRPDVLSVVIRDRQGGKAVTVPLPCGAVPECTPSDLAWSPDGGHVAFALRTPGGHAHGVWQADPAGGPPARLLAFDGTLGGLRYGPGGRLAVLATAGAAKETGAVEAGAAQTGELGTDIREQRIAILENGALKWVSPPDLFVYEYDWRPDGGFVATAAPGDGDDHWWVAKLHAFGPDGSDRVLFAPSDTRLQLAQPRVSPDGARVAFIGGLMSDFGSTGGDAFVLDLGQPATPVDVTPQWRATVTSLAWSCDGGSLRASLLASDQASLAELAPEPRPGPLRTLSAGRQTLRAGEGEALSIACATGDSATVREDFSSAPEIAVGPIGEWHDVTQDNAGWTAPADVRSLSWTHDGFDVQGWLLQPTPASADGTKRPMIVFVHGGPAAAHRARFIGPGWYRDLLARGYALLLPNPRGSYGQGEAFAAANVRDLGHGDLGDILAGVDAAEAAAPIDDARLGIAGWSYGGFMTMFAVTQTDRFHAAFAGAGVSDWLSYYGENGIDAWMLPYFGASVYDDPNIYARSSALTYIKQVRTPTFSVVGERDIECPMPQTLEFWHALDALGVPTGAVVYPGEGHAFHDPKDVADVSRRMVGWFDAHLAGAGAQAPKVGQ